jgi:hypothetical protein
MQATWNQPVAEVAVFSNDFASWRARPSQVTVLWHQYSLPGRYIPLN